MKLNEAINEVIVKRLDEVLKKLRDPLPIEDDINIEEIKELISIPKLSREEMASSIQNMNPSELMKYFVGSKLDVECSKCKYKTYIITPCITINLKEPCPKCGYTSLHIKLEC